MEKLRQTIGNIKVFCRKRKGSCITAAGIVVVLLLIVTCMDFETVDRHNEKKTNETKKRQEILAKLEEEKEVSQAAVLTPTEEQSPLPASSGAALSQETQAADSTAHTLPEQSEALPDDRSEENRQPQNQAAQSSQINQGGSAAPPADAGQADSGKNSIDAGNPEKPVSSGQNGTVREEDEYIMVQMKITCEAVLHHPDLNTTASLPADGILFEGKTVVKKGGSVLDALEAVCTDYGIAYVNKGGASGAYISSIGGLAEKDCGGYSGWKFKVNGTVGGRAASAQKLNANDQVEWYFAATYTD